MLPRPEPEGGSTRARGNLGGVIILFYYYTCWIIWNYTRIIVLIFGLAKSRKPLAVRVTVGHHRRRCAALGQGGTVLGRRRWGGNPERLWASQTRR